MRLGIAYESDLNVAKELIEQTAKTLQESHPDAVHNASPRVLFEGFGESSMDLCVWLRAQSWNAHYRLKDAFIRELHAVLGDAGIDIPFPIRTLRLDGSANVQLPAITSSDADVASQDAPEGQTTRGKQA